MGRTCGVFVVLNSIFLLSIFIIGLESANILFLFGHYTTYSLRDAIQPLANKLVQSGVHNVTFFSPITSNSLSHKGVREFSPKSLIKAYKSIHSYTESSVMPQDSEGDDGEFEDQSNHMVTTWYDYYVLTCKRILGDKEIQEWIRRERGNFDLVILEQGLTECYYGLLYVLNVKKVILFVPLSVPAAHDNNNFGLSPEFPWLHHLFTTSSNLDQPGFFNRLHNIISHVADPWLIETYLYGRVDGIVQEKLGHFVPNQKIPKIQDFVNNVSLIFINQHYSHSRQSSLPPFVVPIGGLHADNSLAEDEEEMEKEIDDFINEETGESYDGFIYISFGSFAKGSSISPALLKMFMNVFRNYEKRLKFLWKWESKPPKKVPKNVLFHPWFPQRQILRHPKIKGFITHCGLISVQQATCYGVPLILTPLFGDQFHNSYWMKKASVGIEINLNEINEVKFDQAIYELIHNSSYAVNAKRLSKACQDRPIPPLDHAKWWVEYVLRSDKETLDLLKSGNMGLPFWRQHCLDVWLFIFTTTVVLILCLLKLVQCLIKICIIIGNSCTATIGSSRPARKKTKRK